MNLLEPHTCLYTDLDLEYADCMSGPYIDCGVDTPDLVCVAGRKGSQVNGYWRPVVCFGIDKLQLSWIEHLWDDWSQDIVYEDYLVDGTLSPISRFLLERGYTAQPVYTQVIDLTFSSQQLKQDLRKSYHSLVNKQDEVWECSLADVRAIHLKVRGVTRSDASWKIQEKMQTVCFTDGERAAVMFYYGPVWAYYACAAGEDGHAAMWGALLKLKELGVRYVEMGEQIFAGPDAKKINIAAYKKGWGGQTRVRLLLRKA